MPGPEMCKKIKDPKQKADCMAYKGKFAKYKKPASSSTMVKKVKDSGSNY
ncbi:MAG: hypothetical protein Unbinned4409contig1002_54 [Prokaryotic dsDNA virus sp.]|nr:MAG: hypothetical protein Unbinned4409contig1002_54 [Prokaryotic dsDNA virus sp.]